MSATSGEPARPNLEDVLKLLAGGTQFSPKTRMRYVMQAVRDEIEESIREELANTGFVEITMHGGHKFRYTFDHATNAWQQAI